MSQPKLSKRTILAKDQYGNQIEGSESDRGNKDFGSTFADAHLMYLACAGSTAKPLSVANVYKRIQKSDQLTDEQRHTFAGELQIETKAVWDHVRHIPAHSEPYAVKDISINGKTQSPLVWACATLNSIASPKTTPGAAATSAVISPGN